MKKIHIIIIACLTYAINALGQSKTEVMQLTIPKSSIKLNENQLKYLSHNGFDDKTATDFQDHIYKKNNLLIYYIYSKVSGPKFKRSLEFFQKMDVSLLSGHSELKSKIYVVDTSEIITLNQIRYLITEYHEKDIKYLKFTSDYDKKLQFINGFIEFSKRDEAEAHQYLADFLNSLHFKE